MIQILIDRFVFFGGDMDFLQGNTYSLGIRLKDSKGTLITNKGVDKIQFIFNDVEYYYGDDGIVSYDEERQCFVLPLEQEETFALKGCVKWQARIKFVDGSVKGTQPKKQYVYDSITKNSI